MIPKSYVPQEGTYREQVVSRKQRKSLFTPQVEFQSGTLVGNIAFPKKSKIQKFKNQKKSKIQKSKKFKTAKILVHPVGRGILDAESEK